MPSQEEYLDNLLKGIETENMETEVTKEPKMTGTEEETAKAPETPEPVEEIGTQVDMSDMDDLLQSALDAQKADSSEQETEASQPVAENTAILPEETASMSEVAAIIFIVNEEAVLVIQQSVMLLQIFQRRRITAFYGIALGNAVFQCGFQTFLLLAQSRFTDGADAPQKKNKQYHKGQNGK